MTNPIKIIHNVQTNEIIERPMNENELAQFEADLLSETEREVEQASKVAARQAVLDKLGLSADEMAALLG